MSYPAAATTAAPAVQLTEAETAEVQAMYDKFKPEAIAEARKYVLARTPAAYQVAMEELIATDFPPPVVEDPPA